MKKILRGLILCFFLFTTTFTFTSCGNEFDKLEQDSLTDEIKETLSDYIDQLINETTSYVPSWNQEGFKGRWNYIDGVFLNSIVNLYNTTKNDKYKNFFLKYIDYYINEDGEFINPSNKQLYFQAGELDSICESKILFDAYEMTKDQRYLNAIEKTYEELMNVPMAANGINFSHKKSYLNQVWLDGMYMYVPFYLRYAALKGMDDIYDDVIQQYKYIRKNMFDVEAKLYYHGHDTTKSVFWANKTTGNSQSFWLRSNGWYIVSLVDSIEYMKGTDRKQYLIDLLKEAIDGLMQYQDKDSKMFYQLIDKKDTSYRIKAQLFIALGNSKYSENEIYYDADVSNYLESSGSSMIAYTLMKGARLGYLDAKLYNDGVSIFKGIYNTCVTTTGGIKLNNICITAGLGPNNKPFRDGSPEYYLAEPVGSNDAKGVGPFLMSYLECLR